MDVTRPIDERATGAGGAGVAAVIVVAISLLSTFTLADPGKRAVDGSTASSDGVPSDYSASPDGGSAQADPGQAAGQSQRRVTSGGRAGTAGTAGDAGTAGGAAENPSGETGSAAQASYDCAKGENAGASDIGVSANEIRLGATVVKTGIAKDFLADAQFGIEAVIAKVNREGGVCNRQIKVDYTDDGWNSATGTGVISKWIGEKNHFGLLVNPSSEGLRGAIEGGLISREGFPVVGADGMLISQYQDDWVWPVATSTYSVMHIMAKDAIARGAKRIAIVAETNYRFGYEGRIAFKAAVERCGGCELVADIEIKGGELSYKNKANEFLGKCGTDFAKCDFVAVLLEPATASQWVADNGLGSGDSQPAVGIGAPQPLFVNSFVRDCGKPCSHLWVWTSFKPPIYPFDGEAAVGEYVSDLRAISTTADANNPHVQGAYVGAQLLVNALTRLGPAPTRAALRQELDALTFDSKLAPSLTFSPENHFAAVSAQAFEAVFNGNSFSNWQHARAFITDTDVQADLGKL